MNRRRYLVVATAAVSSVAGCSQSPGGTDEQGTAQNTPPSTTVQGEPTSPQTATRTATLQSTAETPKEVVRSYVTAIFAGEVQAANALIHPDGNISDYTADAAERNEALNLTIQSITITAESERTATVNVVASFENPEADAEFTRSQTYTLQPHNGTWKLYDSDDDRAA
jgi:uncharacterized protein YchJ